MKNRALFLEKLVPGKLYHSSYNSITKNSYVSIKTKKGLYEGFAELHPDDTYRESKFDGCQYAEMRAWKQAYKDEVEGKKIALKELKDLESLLKNCKEYDPHNIAARKLRRRIYELENEVKTLKTAIDNTEKHIKEIDKTKEVSFKKL